MHSVGTAKLSETESTGHMQYVVMVCMQCIISNAQIQRIAEADLKCETGVAGVEAGTD